MSFLSRIWQPLLRKNLILYNLMVTLSTIIIYFVVFAMLSFLLLLIALTLAALNGIENFLVLENIIIAIILPVLIGIGDLIFCIFLLLKNLRLSKPEDMEPI